MNIYVLITKLLLITVLILLLKLFFVFIISDYIFQNQLVDFLGGNISRFILLLFLVFIVYKYKFYLQRYFKISKSNIYTLSLVALLFILSFINVVNNYNNISLLVVCMFAISTILVGFVEEILFRGIFLPLLIKKWAEKNYGVLMAMIFSSFLFSIMHFINYFKVYKFDIVFSQVIFAFCIGYLFAGIFLYTKNVYLTSMLHSLFNLTFGASVLKLKVEQATSSTTIYSILPTLIIWLLLLIAGHLFYRYSEVRKNNSEFLMINLT